MFLVVATVGVCGGGFMVASEARSRQFAATRADGRLDLIDAVSAP